MFARAADQTDWQIVACQSTETAELATIEYDQDQLTTCYCQPRRLSRAMGGSPSSARREWPEGPCLVRTERGTRTGRDANYWPILAAGPEFDLNETVNFTKGCYTDRKSLPAFITAAPPSEDSIAR